MESAKKMYEEGVEYFAKKHHGYNYVKDFEFLGALPKKFFMMIYGEGGHGKISFLLKFANALAHRGERVLYISTLCNGEKSLYLWQKIVSFKIDSENLLFDFSVDNEYEWMEYLLKLTIDKESIDHLVIEGVRGKVDCENVRAYRKKLPGALIRILDKENGTSGAYESDIQLKTKDGIIIVEKNRYGATQRTYSLRE